MCCYEVIRYPCLVRPKGKHPIKDLKRNAADKNALPDCREIAQREIWAHDNAKEGSRHGCDIQKETGVWCSGPPRMAHVVTQVMFGLCDRCIWQLDGVNHENKSRWRQVKLDGSKNFFYHLRPKEQSTLTWTFAETQEKDFRWNSIAGHFEEDMVVPEIENARLTRQSDPRDEGKGKAPSKQTNQEGNDDDEDMFKFEE